MNYFDVFISHVLTPRPLYGPFLTEENETYLHYLNGNSKRIKKEYVMQLATLVAAHDEDKFFTLLDVLEPQACEVPAYQLDWLEMAFMAFNPHISALLKRSHIMCDPCENEDIMESDVYFLIYVLSHFKEYIVMDIEPQSTDKMGKILNRLCGYMTSSMETKEV